MSEISEIFIKYPLATIHQFAQYFLPEARVNSHLFFEVISSENKKVWVWAETEKDLLERFNRFLNLEIYL